MAMTGLEVFDETMQKNNLWLKEIEAELGPDRHRAYQALRGVLHSLRDRLTIDEAAHLAAQLPMLVRGIYYEGYRPAGKPEKIRSADEFLQHVGEHFRNMRPVDTGDAVRAVFGVLNRHVDPGEIREVVLSLPYPVRTLWPDHERYLSKSAVHAK